jgi:endonuclease VIII-like 1
MPELAEIKIMADFINKVCEEKDFTSISFSESANKRKLGITQPSDLQIFKVSAQARGKELMLSLIQGGSVFMKIRCSMGMSGHWIMCPDEYRPIHTHLLFNTVSKESLCLVDVRRFARWKVAEDWSDNRGPCSLTESEEFKAHIFSNLHKKEFDKPIHLVLMNQMYFNGIGNYLRAEILFKADQDPFMSSREAIETNPKILDLCVQLPGEAYLLGGGQLKDWENPFDVSEKDFSDWIECYGNSQAVRHMDKNGRALWYHTNQIKEPNPSF